MSGAPGTTRSAEQHQYSHRGRAIKSCLECRRRKMRCSRSQPCQNCSRFSRRCVYVSAPDWPSNPSREVQRRSAPLPDEPQNDMTSDPNDFSPHLQSEQQATPTPTASCVEVDRHVETGGTFDANADEAILDQGLQIGKLRITRDIAGLSRIAVSERIVSILSHDIGSNFSSVPQLSPESFGYQLPYYPQLHSNYYPSWHDTTLEPPDGLLLSATRCPPEWGNFFPSREEIHILYHQYYAAVDPIAHIIHKPSFDQECFNLSSSLPSLKTAPASFRALLLAICMAGAVSLSPMQSQLQLGIAKQNELVGKLKVATEKALIDANYMKSVKLQTLQAFAVYMIPQCRAEISRSHAVLIAALIRLAECADLHREMKGSALSAVERQVRRLLWHQICFLDVRTAEAQGHQPIIRDDEFDTPLPLNVDDVSLSALDSLRPFSERWTDATFTLIRYECNLVHRAIFTKKALIDDREVDLESVRRWVDERKTFIEEKYLSGLDENIHVQNCAKVVGRLLTAEFHTILLHRHLRVFEIAAPQHELHDLLLHSSIVVCENAASLDTAPQLAPWSWYVGAYQQYHTCVLLLIEVYCNPRMPQADRIEAVLDHVFGPPSISSRERNREVLRTLAARLDERLVHDFEYMEPTPQGVIMENNLAPDLTLLNSQQRIDQWQSEMYYTQDYTQETTPGQNGDFWAYRNQFAGPEDSTHNDPWHKDFTMSPSMI